MSAGDFAENDVVALAVDVPMLAALGIHAGYLGTVVHRYTEGFDGPVVGYEVEFTDDDGRTIATASVKRDELSSLCREPAVKP